MKTIVRALGLASASMILSASTALAATPVTVSYAACAFAGPAIVPADSHITIALRLGTVTQQQARSLAKATTVYVAVGANPAVTAGAGTVAPTSAGWLVEWDFDTGVDLAAGQALTVFVQAYLSHPLWDGTRDDSGKPVRLPAGALLSPDVACTILTA